MKWCILTVYLFLSACSTIDQTNEADRRTVAEMQAKATQPNAPIELFIRSFGPPTSIETIQGKRVYHYDDPEEPRIAVFNDGKLETYMIDRELLRERNSDSATSESLRLQRGAIIQNLTK